MNKKKIEKFEEPLAAYTSAVLTSAEVKNRVSAYFATQKAVKKAWLFGSFARGDYDEQSDVDILIDVDKDAHITLFDLAEYQHVLQNSLKRKVDFAMTGGLREAFKKNIANDLVLVHEG
ncbi:MAG: nucleotidyltransferase domain-containing protein [Flavobacteriales bacterium]|nr:nucleotidyltransferase domain-containing protein [Flavobacteriales bacterium]